MGFVTNVPSTTITASWGNTEVRNQVVSQLASAAARTSAITSPVAGMVTYLADVGQYERYTGSVWQRLDWNDAWGLVGGKDWGYSATTLVSGITTESLTNVDTGAVSLINGRRYDIRGAFRAVKTATGEIEIKVRDTNASGTMRGYLHTSSLTGTSGYGITPVGAYTCTVNETKTFVMTATNFSGGGSLDITRETAGCYLHVIDIGPAATLTTVP